MATVQVLIEAVVEIVPGKIVMHHQKEASASRMATVRVLIDAATGIVLGKIVLQHQIVVRASPMPIAVVMILLLKKNEKGEVQETIRNLKLQRLREETEKKGYGQNESLFRKLK
jgi:hypothetical protein